MHFQNVEQIRQAKQCGSFLRKNNFFRCSFTLKLNYKNFFSFQWLMERQVLYFVRKTFGTFWRNGKSWPELVVHLLLPDTQNQIMWSSMMMQRTTIYFILSLDSRGIKHPRFLHSSILHFYI